MKILNSLSFILVLFAFHTLNAQIPARDQDFGCISQDVADHFNQDFQINTSSFGGVDLCDNKVDTKKLYNDLTIIEQGNFSSDQSNKLIRGFIPQDQYYSWMKSSTYGIERGQDVPYATAYNSGGYFTMQDGWASLSTLGRVGTVIHEARHTNGYYHIACQQGPYAGSSLPGCDRNYNYGGSHAIEMEYYARVATSGLNFHPVYKKMARLMAVGRSNFVFNQLPLVPHDELLALGQSGQAYLLQNGKWIVREAPNAQGILKRTSAGATLLTNTTPIVFDPYANSGFNWSITDDYSYYKLLNSDRLNGRNYLDFEEFDINQRRYVLIMTDRNEITNFNFPKGQWNSFSRTPGGGNGHFTTWLPNGQYGLFFIDQNLDIYQLDPERPQNSKSINFRWPNDLSMVTKNSSGFFKLSTSSELTLVNPQTGELSQIQTPEKIMQIVSVPLYDSFEVQP